MTERGIRHGAGRRRAAGSGRGTLLTATALAAALCACAPQHAQVRRAAEPVIAAREPQPLLPHEVRTTAGDVFVGNLTAQAAVAAVRAAHDPRWRLRQAELQYFLARLHGRMAGIEACAGLIAALRTQLPGDPDVLLLDARVHSALHRFDASLAALDAAQRAGADAARVQELRAQVRLALGDDATAQALLADLPDTDWSALAARASVLVEQGRLAAAERWYERAQRLPQDTSPWPLAWLHTQHGIALLRNGQLQRARGYLAAAHARLPQYVLAAEHLAEVEARLGHLDAAVALYRQVIARSDDPEFQAALADAERLRGNHAAAVAAERAAHEGYAHWLARQPDAFAHHAAAFYSGIGEHAQALSLARRNRELRGDASSLLLLATVAVAAGDTAGACAALAEARATGLSPPELHELAAGLSCTRAKGPAPLR